MRNWIIIWIGRQETKGEKWLDLLLNVYTLFDKKEWFFFFYMFLNAWKINDIFQQNIKTIDF